MALPRWGVCTTGEWKTTSSASSARLALEGENRFFEAKPGDEPSHEAVLLTEVTNGMYCAATEETEITDFRNHSAVDHFLH